MKNKKTFLTLASALCAMILFALYCANPDFNNPLDSKNLPINNEEPIVTVPNAPIGVLASAQSTNTILITWDAVSDAIGYYVYRSSISSGIYAQIDSTLSPTISYTNTGLSANTTYYYRVAAYNSAGTGEQSSAVYATTLIELPDLPGTPTGVTAFATSSSTVGISWNAVTGATGYYVYRSLSLDGTYTQIGSSAITSFFDVELSSNTTYYYRVAAHNSIGTGELSSAVYVLTPELLAPPTNVRAEAVSANSITISWDAVPGATGYVLYRSSSLDGLYSEFYGGGYMDTTSYTDNGHNIEGFYHLIANTTYYYRVATVNNAGTGAQSNPVSATTLPGPPPPTDITAIATSPISISLSWNSVPGITNYNIYLSTNPSGPFLNIGGIGYGDDNDNIPPRLTLVDFGGYRYDSVKLSANTTYYYRIAARIYDNVAGTSEIGSLSTIVSATTLNHGFQFNPNITYGTLTDLRDGKTYRTVEIGTQTWMAENLNYNVSGSGCLQNTSAACDVFGRLYSWNTAMAGFPSSNETPSGVRGICPEGWHLPSDAEWDTLVNFVSNHEPWTAGTKLKSAVGWASNHDPWGNYFTQGTDEYGFSALPYGGAISDSSEWLWLGSYDGYWRSASETDGSNMGTWTISHYSEYINVDTYPWTWEDGIFRETWASVRCVKD